jgi:endogenous inhibitor of DNA gyrase (YacG/DUF329 family)
MPVQMGDHMSETNSGDRTTCAVCGKPLENNLQGWRHRLYCSIECELLAARWQLNEISSVAGHASDARPIGAGGASAPSGKGQPGHAGGAPAQKTSAR